MSRRLSLGLFFGLSILLVLGAGCAPSLIHRGKSPDHRRMVELHYRGGQHWIEIDGNLLGPYEGVAAASIVFSPDGNHLAFPVVRDSSWVVVRDGVEGAAWDGVGSPVFSPTGSRMAHAAEMDGRWYVVNEGRAGAPVDSVLSSSLTFSPEGGRLAYAAWTEGGLRVIADGEQGRSWSAVSGLIFTEDGTLYYVASDGRGMALVRDERVLSRHESIGWLTLGHGGRRLAYAASDGGPWYVVLDGREEPPYPGVHGLAFEPYGLRFAYVAGDDHEEILIVDGKSGRSWREVLDPVFNDQGGHLGYIARTDTLSVALIDGQAVGAHRVADNLVLNSMGNRWAYMVTEEGSMAVVDDRGRYRFPLLVGESLVFSRDGEHWGCLAGNPEQRRLFLAVDGAETPVEFDWTLFSSTVSAHVEEMAAGEVGMDLLRDWVRAELELWLAEPLSITR